MVLTPFPFAALRAAKRRPAVVISADWFNVSRQDRLLVAVTSFVPEQLDRDELRIPDDELADAGLPCQSVIKLGKVASVKDAVIVRPLGKLSDRTLLHVLERMSEVLGLA